MIHNFGRKKRVPKKPRTFCDISGFVVFLCGRFVSIYVNEWLAVKKFFSAAQMMYYATFFRRSSPLSSIGKKPE